KKIEGISDLRDESSREGMRIVVEIKKDSNANVVLNQLYKHTRIQDTFGVIMLALVDREPKVLNLKEMLTHYLNFQEEIVIRRTKYDLNKALDRVHILEGFKIIFDHLDEVIRLIRASKNDKEALVNLINTFSLSEKQAQAVLDMRLRRLTNLEINRIIEEYEDLLKQINYFNSLLENESMILNIIKDELIEIRRKYADERRTKIESYYGEIEAQNLIEEKNVVITLTGSGYIKSISEDAYTSQKRGGKGIIATTTKEDDFVDSLLVTSTHNNLLFLSNKGKAYKLKAYEIQEAGRVAKGSNIINILPLENGEKIQDIISIKDLNEDGYLLMATKQGKIKKTELKNFANIRKSGIIAITLADGDELLKVKRTMGDAEIVIVTALGYAIRFSEKDVRSMGRSAAGIKAITLRKSDVAVSMDIIVLDEELFVVSENGYGKRTPIEEYTITRRGAKGIKTYKISEKTGKIIGARMVSKNDEIMLMNSSNTAIRLNVSDISSIGRNAIGVKLMKLKENDPIVALTKISTKEESDE
ncbi:MAG: DNA gyrase subunit A, partial [Oscillospiraceae bacterium]|nr:DNA gyrase subunit A [Oscillospiraceae bacterium]